jgi:hypothetical protein
MKMCSTADSQWWPFTVNSGSPYIVYLFCPSPFFWWTTFSENLINNSYFTIVYRFGHQNVKATFHSSVLAKTFLFYVPFSFLHFLTKVSFAVTFFVFISRNHNSGKKMLLWRKVYKCKVVLTIFNYYIFSRLCFKIHVRSYIRRRDCIYYQISWPQGYNKTKMSHAVDVGCYIK